MLPTLLREKYGRAGGNTEGQLRSSLFGRNGDEGQVFAFAGVGKGEEQHHQRKHLFRGQVGIVDPEIDIAIKNGNKGVLRARFRTVNANEPKQIGGILFSLLQARESAMCGKVLVGHFDLGRHRLHEAENGASDYRHFIFVS